jgi:hypothetical protein
MSVKVLIHQCDRKIAAMAKALAWEVGGPLAVKGSSQKSLCSNGYLTFNFDSSAKGEEFSQGLEMYLPKFFARILK